MFVPPFVRGRACHDRSRSACSSGDGAGAPVRSGLAWVPKNPVPAVLGGRTFRHGFPPALLWLFGPFPPVHGKQPTLRTCAIRLRMMQEGRLVKNGEERSPLRD